MNIELTIEKLLVDQVKDLKEHLALEQSRVISLERDRAEWDAERNYLVNTVMQLTGAARVNPRQDEEADPTLDVPVQSGPRRQSWPQVMANMEKQSKIRVLQHKQALASAAKGVQNATQ